MTVDSPFIKMVDELDKAESDRITSATEAQEIGS